jgi:hypothetical protein
LLKLALDERAAGELPVLIFGIRIRAGDSVDSSADGFSSDRTPAVYRFVKKRNINGKHGRSWCGRRERQFLQELVKSIEAEGRVVLEEVDQLIYLVVAGFIGIGLATYLCQKVEVVEATYDNEFCEVSHLATKCAVSSLHRRSVNHERSPRRLTDYEFSGADGWSAGRKAESSRLEITCGENAREASAATSG